MPRSGKIEPQRISNTDSRLTLREDPRGRLLKVWQVPGPPGHETGPWAAYDNIIPGPHIRSLELIDEVTGKPDLSRYLMCPADVIGFDLKSRIWRKY